MLSASFELKSALSEVTLDTPLLPGRPRNIRRTTCFRPRCLVHAVLRPLRPSHGELKNYRSSTFVWDTRLRTLILLTTESFSGDSPHRR